VLRAAVDLADDGGIESLSMRRIGQALGVEAMSLYNHVANKDDILDGIVDLVWGEVEPPAAGVEWRSALRGHAISAHEVLLKHPWACTLAMTRDSILPARLRYMEAILRVLREADFPDGLTFHAYHALDSHTIGFTLWEVGHSIPAEGLEDLAASFLDSLPSGEFPHLVEHVEQHLGGLGAQGHDGGEFMFILELLLDGFERARRTASDDREG
jgi:AcrR family transcriptional regulator